MKRMRKRIYLDYAGTTPVDPAVVEAILPYFYKKFGNTASLHWFGRQAQEALEKSRQIMATALGAGPEEIIFTSSATESNNTVLKGVAFANKNKGRHIIISPIEHDCIIQSAKWLEKQGFTVTKLPVDKNGLVDPAEINKAIRKDTILVSVMHGNNEIGTRQPISQIGQICRQKGVLFHTDAAQTFGRLVIDVQKMNIDLLTASSHKLYGPKGAALLYIRKGVKIEPLLHGGGHESGLRSSTVNVPAIVGFAKATEIYDKLRNKEIKKLRELRDKLISGILSKIPNSYLNGEQKNLLPNIANIRFSGVEGESIMMQLDMHGVAVSTGSACSSQNLQPSHVLTACGLKPQEIHGSIRFSLGRWTTKEEIDYVISVLPKIIYDLRKISPFGRRYV